MFRILLFKCNKPPPPPPPATAMHSVVQIKEPASCRSCDWLEIIWVLLVMLGWTVLMALCLLVWLMCFLVPEKTVQRVQEPVCQHGCPARNSETLWWTCTKVNLSTLQMLHDIWRLSSNKHSNMSILLTQWNLVAQYIWNWPQLSVDQVCV